jgi:hypothetical protein
VPLRSKSLAFLIENSSNQNSSQLADNKQKRPVLIENFEPNRARVFAPSHAPQIAPMSDGRRSFAAFLSGTAQHIEIDVTHSKQSSDEFLPGARIACQRVLSRLNKASSPRVLGTEKRCADEPSREVSTAPDFVEALSKKSTCLNHPFRAGSPAREAALLTGLPRAFFAKGSVCSNTFLPGFALRVEIDVTHSNQTTGEFLPGARTAFMGLQTRWLLAPLLHLTDCRLNRLQLFPLAGVSTNWRLQRIMVCADNVGMRSSEDSFVVE